MGIQTMGSQGGGGGGGQQSQFQPLSRQSSLYSLTPDEVQNQLGDLGKPLSSMNLDELLKNVWTAETNQAMGMDVANAASAGQLASASALQRQASLTLIRALSKKTVDDVWIDIQQGQKNSDEEKKVQERQLQRQASLTLIRALSKKTVDEVWTDIQQGQKNSDEEKKVQERQPTLGEMTLEDFLVKAGVVAEASSDMQNVGTTVGVDQGAAPPQSFPQQSPWLQYSVPPMQQQQQQQHQQHQQQHPQQNMMGVYMPGHPVPQPLPLSGTPLLDARYPDNQLAMSSPLLGTLTDTQTPGRKRVAPGDIIEKTVERRQKRMIKNRESAARSRARKQAYTNELENKVSRLEEENERLKKQKIE
ncbi:PREDICTED: ABSCISIC ACID-INSENSITIVE 5-like protein 2 isoform X2 [Nelumbo nucifera]|uniref:ABSCISIC ACID-INSENSITIVE 5-like protein 2 isoform X2 n=1 Tax=Nelumbo nucifera TaxID=4432 RepID=A0A1U7Z5L5_NELNU|nr:PREDICTED: ABSCISIC ACID-INSENSITIVE 5-like protein 2 isoform X2 [Nelumbo nucifera]